MIDQLGVGWIFLLMQGTGLLHWFSGVSAPGADLGHLARQQG